MALALDECVSEIKRIKSSDSSERPIYPMIILKTKKGWTGPKEVKGNVIEGTFRAHQVPISISRDNPENLRLLEDWLRSYHPEELFTSDGKLISELECMHPTGNRRMSANPIANGGLLLKELRTPDFRDYALKVKRGETNAQDMKELGKYVADLIKLNPDN